MAYETKEAEGMWAANQPADTVDKVARAKAGNDLLEAVEAMATKYGFRVSKATDEEYGTRTILKIKESNGMSSHATLTVFEGGEVVAGWQTMAKYTSSDPAVVYDNASKMYVGTQDDAFYEPVLGAPKHRKRDALAVVTEALLAFLVPKRA